MSLLTLDRLHEHRWNLFAGNNDDTTMRAMMHAFVDKSRLVDGIPTSLAEIGYLSVGMDDGFQLCNCSGSHGQNDHYPHSLYNVSCSGDNNGESANACRDGRCTWHNQTDGRPMIDTLKFPVSEHCLYNLTSHCTIWHHTISVMTIWHHTISVMPNSTTRLGTLCMVSGGSW